jgi:hypothetical protein
MYGVAFLLLHLGAAQFFQPAQSLRGLWDPPAWDLRAAAPLALEQSWVLQAPPPALAQSGVFQAPPTARHQPRSAQDGGIVAGLAALTYVVVLVAAGRLGVSAFAVYGHGRGAIGPSARMISSIPRRSQRTVRMALASGDALGDFSLANQDGTAVTSDSIKGQRTLFWIYPKADTGG